MIQDPELRAAVEHARDLWEKRSAEQPGAQLSLTVPRARLRFCFDCNRRFYNLGWHAEACGSSNHALVTEED